MKLLAIILIAINLCFCRDYYVGMFKENDYLVAQDRLYKERVPYRSIDAKYGRIFQCPITYFRVVDRLGIGRGPGVRVIRGGLRQKYLVLRLKSQYNYPISVNIYVGCENKMTTKDPYLTTTEAIHTTKGTVKTNTTKEKTNSTHKI